MSGTFSKYLSSRADNPRPARGELVCRHGPRKIPLVLCAHQFEVEVIAEHVLGIRLLRARELGISEDVTLGEELLLVEVLDGLGILTLQVNEGGHSKGSSARRIAMRTQAPCRFRRPEQ